MNEATFEQELPDLLNQLKPEMKPLWGIMSPQHMVEHLIITWKISRGRIPVKLHTEKGLDERRAFLISDIPYDKNLAVPGLEGKLLPLRFPDLETAKSALVNELKLFHEHHRQNPEATYTNPIFGDLDYGQWLHLHYKHSQHHLNQFGLS